jgi:regulator of sigma E protease
MSWIIGGLAFVFVLGAAVVLHEFGHFAVAKLLKIRVETFSVGFGPRLWGFKWGTTDYRLSAIPLGGYVKLGGDESNAPIEGESAADIPPEEQFNLRPRWQKISVAVAGPVMNIITALSIPAAGALMFGVPQTPMPVVQAIQKNGVAEVAGLKPGDKIVSFNGVDNPSWDRIRGDALLLPGAAVPITVERDGQRVPLTIKPISQTEGTDTVGLLDITPDYGNFPVLVNSVIAGGPAEKAGLQAGDRFVTIGGEPVHSSEQVRSYIREHKTEPIEMAIDRKGQQLQISARVGRLPDGTEGLLGVTPYDDVPRIKVGPIKALAVAVDTNLEILRLTGAALGQFYHGQRSARNTLSGPIGIARAASTSANELGWSGVFQLLGFLSLSLGVFNLLPIPVLDGGAIFLLLVEAVLGVVGIVLSMNVRERIQQVGFVVLLLLMGFVITNDLIKEATLRFGWGAERPQVVQPQK